ncbi:MAG: molybdopterin-dependent oxidoreductase [Methanobacteriota archaeon]
MKPGILIILSSILLFSGCIGTQNITIPDTGISQGAEPQLVEIREYQGEKLSSVGDFRENSIKGPQKVPLEGYSLTVDGLVENPLNLTYEQTLLTYKSIQKIVTLHCVEGWSNTLLYEGIPLADIFADAKVKPEANTVIFHAFDGYTSSLPLDFIYENNIILAHKMNNITLPSERGFPFQVVAEDKYGYKWVKWVVKIELTDNPDYKGYWESRGYSNNADV